MGLKPEDVIKYRIRLLEYGKRYTMENPDNLNKDELLAVTAQLFYQVNQIDMSFGHPYYETGIKIPASISKPEQDMLFADMLDWFQIVRTPGQAVLNYFTNKYPVKDFKRVLCVGDGRKCHLGRKLAMKGYNVVSVDPEAQTMFSWSKNINKAGGNFLAVKASFYSNSEDMIRWADAIVGSKIPPIVQELVNIEKPVVFTISANPEIYKMRFNGVLITSEKQFEEQIKKCKGVKATQITIKDNLSDLNVTVFEKGGRVNNYTGR